MKSYLAIGAISAVATFLLTFVMRTIAPRVGLVVPPDESRVHERPMRTAGGTAMFVAFLIAMGVASRLPSFRPLFEASSEPLGVILAAAIAFMVGLIDDRRELSPPAKTAGLVIAGSVLYFLGVTMFFFRVPFADFVVLSPDLAPLMTVLWLYGMTTAVNWIDGLDGLAAGIVAIAGMSFFVYANRLGANGLLAPDNIGPLVAIIAVGVCVGFLPHNFHPARIMMGDAGALFLGTLMAVTTLVVGGRTADQFSGQTFFFYAPIFIPFFILGVPMVDAFFAIVRRTIKRADPSGRDREHLHHRLMRLGHGQRRSVTILWAWTTILCAFVLYPTFTNSGNHLIPLGTAALGVALYTLFHPQIRQRDDLGSPDGTAAVDLRLVDDARLDETGPAGQAHGR